MLGRERVANGGDRIGGVVHPADVARVIGLADDRRDHRRILGHFAGECETDRREPHEGIRLAGVEAHQNVGEDGGVETALRNRDRDDARFVLALETVEQSEREGRIDRVAEAGVVDDAD